MVKVLKKLWKWIKLPSHLLVYLPFDVHARLYVGSLLESHPLRHKKIKENGSESESLDNGMIDWIVWEFLKHTLVSFRELPFLIQQVVVCSTFSRCFDHTVSIHTPDPPMICLYL